MPFPHDETRVTLPELDQIALPSGRVYRVKTGPDAGMVFPSVTRMLKAKEQKGLDAWRKRVGEVEAAKVSARATVQGHAFHSLCERFLSNVELPTPQPHVAQLWSYIRPWLIMNVTKVHKIEANLYSKKLLVAGRTDLLADVNDIFSIVDFKTANRVKKPEWIEDYFIQGTFYAASLFELTGIKAKRIILPIVHPDGLQLEECKPMKHFDALMDRIDIFYRKFNMEGDEVQAATVKVEDVKKCVKCGIEEMVADEAAQGFCQTCLDIATRPTVPWKRR